MRVLQITPSFHPAYVYGGATRAVFDLCSKLGEAGCDITVLTTDANGPRAVLDVDTHRDLPLGERFSVRYCHRVMDVAVSPGLLKAIPGYMRASNIVHLHAVYSFTTIPALTAARAFGRPVVWSTHGMLQRWRGSTRRRLKSFWEQACRIVSPTGLVLHFTSEEEKRESLGRFPGFRNVVIPNVVDFPARLARTDRNGSLRLLYLGRLDPKKGLENLIQACRLLNEQDFIKWNLSIAGDGDSTYRSSLESLVHASRLSEQVKMLGRVEGDAKSELFGRSDLVVVPSHTENFGLVVGEALAHEVPVIASKGTPWGAIEGVGCGLWVDNSPESISRSIKRAAQMPIAEMGRRGRAWIDSTFTGPKVATRFVDLYRSLLSADI